MSNIISILLHLTWSNSWKEQWKCSVTKVILKEMCFLIIPMKIPFTLMWLTHFLASSGSLHLTSSITLKNKHIIFQYLNFGIEFATNFSLVKWNSSTTASSSEQNIYKQLPLRAFQMYEKNYLVCQINFLISLSCHRFLNNLSFKELVLILLTSDC